MLYKQTKQNYNSSKKRKEKNRRDEEKQALPRMNRPQPRTRLFPTQGFLGERKHALSARALGFQDERSGTKF